MGQPAMAVSIVSAELPSNRSGSRCLGQGDTCLGQSDTCLGLAHTSTPAPQARGQLCPMRIK